MGSTYNSTFGRRLGLLTILIAAVLLFALPSAFALAKGKKIQGKVTAITATSITIESKKNGATTYTFAPTPAVTIEGKTAKVSDVQIGMRVKIESPDGKTATSVETVVRKKKAAPLAPATPVTPAPLAPAPTPAPANPPATSPSTTP